MMSYAKGNVAKKLYEIIPFHIVVFRRSQIFNQHSKLVANYDIKTFTQIFINFDFVYFFAF